MFKTDMDWQYHLKEYKYIKWKLNIYYKQTSTTNATQKGPNKVIEFADFGVFKAWQLSKYNVRRDPIFEFETLMGMHRVKEVGGATSHDPSRSQLASHHKASVFSGLLMGKILFLKLRHFRARINSKRWEALPSTSLAGFNGLLPQS